MNWRSQFADVIVLDFEFIAEDGEKPRPVCLVSQHLKSGIQNLLWLTEETTCPFPDGDQFLFVGYFASAEWNCFLTLNWDLPRHVIDLYAEYRLLTNGLSGFAKSFGFSLVAAAEAFDITTMDNKTEMRDLIMSGGPWSEAEKNKILNYCAMDVAITGKLFKRMWPDIASGSLALNQALFRGRYTVSVAKMEYTGVPIDSVLFSDLMTHWPQLKEQLIKCVDQDYGIYEHSTFKQAKFENWVVQQKIPWPTTDKGNLKTDEATFRQISKSYPQVATLHELRVTLSKMSILKLCVGRDGRSRALLSPFASKTGRNQPSTTKFIFGNSAWLRSLIKPEEGFGLAYIDFSSQEIAIAAALSGDQKMWDAYMSGDPYTAFAIQAGLAPKGANKSTHKEIRNRCKQIVLGVGYGMGAEALARSAGIHKITARKLLNSHKQTYRVFWQWAEANQMRALMGEPLFTPLGWKIQLRRDPDPNDRSLLNWPMQSTGSDIMRLAACELTENGIEVCCPIHDAFLIAFPLTEEAKIIREASQIMVNASESVMGRGYACRVDAEIVRYPSRYMDERGASMFSKITTLLDKLKSEERAIPAFT